MTDPSHLSVNRVQGMQSHSIKAPQPASLQILGSVQINQAMSAQTSGELMNANFNPLAIARRFVPLPDRVRRMAPKPEEQKTEEQQDVEVEGGIQQVEKVDKTAEFYEKKNPEFKDKDLVLLREKLKNSDSKEDILKKVLDAYPDYTLADEALDFLLETTFGSLRESVQEAKDELNTVYEREIKAGKNIATEAKEFAQKGLGSPTDLRNMYRDITGNPRDTVTLFEELSNEYHFEQLQPVIFFLLQSLGSDLKAAGPSISRAELHRLITDTRALQAILGIYRFYKSRMRLLFSAFRRHELTVPSRLTFEKLAKLFVKFLQERYPTLEKALKMATELGISEELIAQIIVFTQMRDAVRQIAPRIFRSEQHRQDILTTFLQLIEELDEQLEEEQEEGEEEDDDEEENEEEEKT